MAQNIAKRSITKFQFNMFIEGRDRVFKIQQTAIRCNLQYLGVTDRNIAPKQDTFPVVSNFRYIRSEGRNWRKHQHHDRRRIMYQVYSDVHSHSTVRTSSQIEFCVGPSTNSTQNNTTEMLIRNIAKQESVATSSSWLLLFCDG